MASDAAPWLPWRRFFLRPVSRQEGFLGAHHFGGGIAAREEMAVTIGRHLIRGVPEASLYFLDGQLQAAIRLAIDAP
jgi:hypothetical protein